jgi:hypothetical protein
MDAIFLRKPFKHIILVLPDTLHKVARHAYVWRSVALASEDVDSGLFHGLLDSRLRGNDGGLGSRLRGNDG